MDEPPSSLIEIFARENVLYYLFTVLFLFVASLLSASEAAFFSFDASDIEHFRRNKNGREKPLHDLLVAPRVLLSALILWKYFFLIAAVIIFTLASVFDEGGRLVYEVIFLTLTFAFFGVIIPKLYGHAHNRSVALRLAPLCKFIVRFSKPVIMPLVRISAKLEKRIEEVAEENSVRELTHALELAATDQTTTEDQKEILRGIVNFGTLSVADVMRDETEIHSVDVSLNFHDLLIYIKKSGFSRLPAYHENFEKIEGILYIKDLLPYLNEPKKFNWQKLLRPAYFVHETKRIDALFKEFQEKRVHIALALNEQGKVSGVITLEDIIEEIIGDIHDEFDEAGGLFRKIDDKTLVFSSKITATEFCRLMDLDPHGLPIADENDTLGDMLMAMNKELPRIGNQVQFDQLTFVIEAVDHKKIKRVRVHVHETKPS